MIVNIHEAKTNFSRLAKRALAGEEILIARNGQPLLKLIPLEQPQGNRIPGLSKGLATSAKDFTNPLPVEIIQEFEK